MMRQATRPKRSGTALVEMVLCLPFLAFIISVIFFFGWMRMNQQHVWAADRYAVWRSFYGWPAMQSEQDGHALSPDETLNELFFRNQAEGISIGGGAGDDPESIEGLVNAAGQLSSDAEALADHSAAERWPHARGGSVSAAFPTTQGLWRTFTRRIGGHCYREGVAWRRGQVSYLETIRDLFLADLDSVVRGCSLKDELQALYLRQW